MKTKIILLSCLTIFFFGGLLSCSNDSESDFSVKNDLDNYKEVFSNAKFVCYKSKLKTRSDNEQELIKITDIPDVNIYFGINNDISYKDYANKSIFMKNGVKLCTLYTSVEKVEGGFILKYNRDGEDIGTSFFPDIVTRVSGQDSLDCFLDAYSNHGWASLWATVQSIFIPETGVALAAACIIENM